MIEKAENYPISTLLSVDANVAYAIPRYQREYTWGKAQWEALFDDLVDNDEHYFLGSIICINTNTDPHQTHYLELVDGQQRMTSLSIFLAALFKLFSELKDLSQDESADLINLKYKLVLKKNPRESRVIPQIQNNNLEDYLYVLSLAGALEARDAPGNAGNRRIVRAFRYYQQRIGKLLENVESPKDQLNNLISKVNTATLVQILVKTHSDAYTLFESLNNRGTPLTAIDLIKNKLLASLAPNKTEDIDQYYDRWKRVIEALSDDYAVQERFFRQYYNAYRNELKAIASVPVATKSNLMQVYEKLITHDPEKFLSDMVRLSAVYAKITNTKPVENPRLSSLLLSLERVQAASAYLLLLFLFDKQKEMLVEESHLEDITEFLIRFFVRRNTTDLPPTRDHNRIFMDVAENCLNLQGNAVVNLIKEKLIHYSASDERFKESLSGLLYEDNKAVCRFVLCSLEEEQMTKERSIDLWQVKGKQFVWTIEHIFPQGDNIPQPWVDMIANGDKVLASQYRDQYVHQLGNLTISGYNGSLGNKSFVEKQSRADQKGRPVGYNNGLFLNRELASESLWTIEKIQKRTEQLVEQITKKYALRDLESNEK